MQRLSSMNRSVAALLALLLLLMQVTGLHQHRHVEASGENHGHSTQIHFEDAGIHADDPEHAHTGTTSQAAHPHTDVETKVLDSGLTKLLLDFSFIALLSSAMLLFCLPSIMRQMPRQRIAPPPQRPPRYTLRPPTNAPPLTRAIAV